MTRDDTRLSIEDGLGSPSYEMAFRRHEGQGD